MCFDLPYSFKKGKLIIVRSGKNEEKEEIGLLVKEVEKWKKKRSEMKVDQGEEDAHASSSLNHKN